MGWETMLTAIGHITGNVILSQIFERVVVGRRTDLMIFSVR